TVAAHGATCARAPVPCPQRCAAAPVPRDELDAHLRDTAPRRVAVAHTGTPGVGFKLDIRLHGATCARAPVPCPQRCAAAPVPRDELDAHLRDHCAAAGVACAYRDAGCRFKGTRQALERHTEESCQSHLSLVLALAARQARQLEALRGAVARLACGCSGALVWRLTDVAAKMADACTKDGVELVSPAFYTSQYGYKLQVSFITYN
ncbi:hypothetical protein evm_015363, partial [Chilo suppressalis]